MNRPRYYVLDDAGEPLAVDMVTWAWWLEQPERRRVAFDRVGLVEVSTVFLGLDYAFGGGPPVLWETLVFGGECNGAGGRYSSRADALAGHAEILARVRTTENVHG